MPGKQSSFCSKLFLDYSGTNLWHEIGRVDPSSLGINSAKLALVVVDELDGLGLQVPEGDGFGEGGHSRKGTSFRSKNL